MFQLSDKIIFIISPNKWGKMKLSKHHYAVGLANAGNRVYFIEPPDLSLPKRISVLKMTDHPGLFIVSYIPFARGRRFLPKFIFKLLLKREVKILKAEVQATPDLVISFDPFRFENLKWFGAKHAIYFAADLYPAKSLPGEVTSADFCLGVSPTIISLLKKNNPLSFFINHGLNTEFETLALNRLTAIATTHGKKIKVGYIGNLLMGAPDRFMMKRVINAHPELSFVFWGQYEKRQDHMVPHEKKDVKDFVEFLELNPNTELRGPKHQTDLVKEIDEVDMFWICYDLRKSWLWDGSNSHKILEYLATGKPVISHHIETYKDTGLLYMVDNKKNEGYEQLFDSVLEIVKAGEDPSLGIKRLQFALSNSYSKQINYIEEKINEVNSLHEGHA